MRDLLRPKRRLNHWIVLGACGVVALAGLFSWTAYEYANPPPWWQSIPSANDQCCQVTSATFAVKVANNRKYGRILVDANGMTLYTLTQKGRAVPCTGPCASAWPLLTVPGNRTGSLGPPGLTGLSTTKVNGALQVAYRGLPLFLFAGDSAPGQANGQGLVSFGGVWLVVKAASSGP